MPLTGPRVRRRIGILLAALLVSAGALAAKDTKGAKAAKEADEAHTFAVIGHSFADGFEGRLQQALEQGDGEQGGHAQCGPAQAA